MWWHPLGRWQDTPRTPLGCALPNSRSIPSSYFWRTPRVRNPVAQMEAPQQGQLFARFTLAAPVLLPQCWRQIAPILPLAWDPTSRQPLAECTKVDDGGTRKGAGSLGLAELRPGWMLCSLCSTQKVQEGV